MGSQIFVSYRRNGGDVSAKLISETLKNRGYTVFYDYDAIKDGRFDESIRKAIDGCNDFLLVLPPNALDRCVNENDWVRQEIRQALEGKKNIIPVTMSGFVFPSMESLPDDIREVCLYSGIRFVMDYYDAVIDAIVERLVSKPGNIIQDSPPTSTQSDKGEVGVLTIKRSLQYVGVGCSIRITIDGKNFGGLMVGKTVSFTLPYGTHNIVFTDAFLSFNQGVSETTIELSQHHRESELVIKINALNGKPIIRIVK